MAIDAADLATMIISSCSETTSYLCKAIQLVITELHTLILSFQ